MLTWLRQNGIIISIVGTIVLLIGHVAVSQYQLSVLVGGMAVISNHIHDSTRHLDPQRDAEALRLLTDRIDKLEQRVERSERWRAWMTEQERSRWRGNDK